MSLNKSKRGKLFGKLHGIKNYYNVNVKWNFNFALFFLVVKKIINQSSQTIATIRLSKNVSIHARDVGWHTSTQNCFFVYKDKLFN
jgi:hypothetical protein